MIRQQALIWNNLEECFYLMLKLAYGFNFKIGTKDIEIENLSLLLHMQKVMCCA